MPREEIYPRSLKVAVERITFYLQNRTYKAIYWDGYCGLGASTVLRDFAQNLPPSLASRFSKIIHIDCSKWKSRRALQRAIAEEVRLPRQLMAIFDRQDEEDDFSGVPEGSRAEIQEAGRLINLTLRGTNSLVIFHNGSSETIDLDDLGISFHDKWADNALLWTFRGRLRLIKNVNEKVDGSHVHLYLDLLTDPDVSLREEATKISQYTARQSVTPKIAAQCCQYLLVLHYEAGNIMERQYKASNIVDIMDYNWVIHAPNYWVCDGVIQGGHDTDEEAWDAAAALHQQLQLEDYSSNTLPSFFDRLSAPPKRWNLVRDSTIVPPESTSFFCAAKIGSERPLAALPDDMFHQSDKLRVLKLYHCAFNFSSPPFKCCRSLRFLGLERCKDIKTEEQEKQEKPWLQFSESLWVLDICHMDWELDSKTIQKMSTNMREVHINNGRMWHSNLAWRQLQNLRKLRVIEPTSPWETCNIDEFTDMVKLELLDLSRNIEMRVLPSLSGATSLKTLVLDGCARLEHVGPKGLPPSLEFFSFDGGSGGANISRISLVGCVRLMNFRLRGSLQNLEELDLSGTSIKSLDLKHASSLQQIILLRCEQLRSILWPEKGMPQLRVIGVDTRGGEVVRKVSPDYLEHHAQDKDNCHTYVATMDIRFVQSLVLRNGNEFSWITGRGGKETKYVMISPRVGVRMWNREYGNRTAVRTYPESLSADRFSFNLCLSRKDSGHMCIKENFGRYSTGFLHQKKSPITDPCCRSYADVPADELTGVSNDGSISNDSGFDQPVDNNHMEIGEGISYPQKVEDVQWMEAMVFMMDRVQSLHVHDNHSITSIIPEQTSTPEKHVRWSHLKQCRVERCHRMQAVFTMNYNVVYMFNELETFCAAHLPMVHCIWRRGMTSSDTKSFAKLRSMHLQSCTRLMFVLPLFWDNQGSFLPSLETLHIVNCGDLRQVFPVLQNGAVATGSREGTVKVPKLKHVYLHDLPSLEKICGVKMLAPMLEMIRVRGCWGLRRIPAIGCHRRDARAVCDGERDWWNKLQWDGLDVGHGPSLYEQHHPPYYRKPLPRGSVLQ